MSGSLISHATWTAKYSFVLQFGLLFAILLQQPHESTGTCFNSGAPYDDDNSRQALPDRSQAIVPTYVFRCCGTILNWRAYFQPGGMKHTTAYTVNFQVWRPVPNQAQKYTLVADTRANPQLSGTGEASVDVSNSITVQPGDVVGYYAMLNDGGNGGIQLEISDHGSNVVWHNPAQIPLESGQEIQLGTGSSYTSMTAAPVISIDVSSMECPTTAATPVTSINTARIVTTQPATNAERTITVERPGLLAGLTSSSISLSLTSDSSEMEIAEKQSNSSVIAAVLVIIILLILGSGVATFIGCALWMAKRNKIVIRKANNQFTNPNYNGNYLKVTEMKSRTQSVDNPYELVSTHGSTYIKADLSDTEYKGKAKHSSVQTKYPQKPQIDDPVEISGVEKITSKEQEQYHAYDLITQKCMDDDEERIIYESPGIVVPDQKARKEENYDTMKKYSKLAFLEKKETFWVPARSSEALYDQLASKQYREIPRKEIEMLEKIGSGQFGTVCKAVWKLSAESFFLAVKQLHSNSTSTERIKILQEAAIMGQFWHNNVVKLYGLVSIGNPVCLCLEYMSKGTLKEYMASIDIKKQSPPSGHKDLQSFFVKAALDLASGMKYLSSKAFIHRDLAARNVLLNEFYTCKIGDFGMARDLMDDTYYTSTDRGKIPVRWTSPEALLYRKYSTASDVWSFGMVLFEIWSLGKKPFPSFTINQVMGALQKEGYCQQPPPGCPSAIYKLMVDCWNPDHHQRPAFEQVVTTLQQPLPHLLHFNDHQYYLPPAAADLGGDFRAARKLHLDLQEIYNKQH